MIAVLSGGVGAARLLTGLAAVMDPAGITAVVNTGDDLEWQTLRVCPDLDTVTYALAGAEAPTGWGLSGESWNTLEALRRFSVDTWFQIGDRDLATHLYRSARLSEGAPLHEVAAEIAAAYGVRVRLLPMSDDPVRTRLTLTTGEEVDFQEYFVHRRHEVEVRAVRFAGVESARPAPGVLEFLEGAERIVVAPSNPIVSIGPILAVPGISDVLQRRRSDVVAVSPIIEGRALKGPADRLLRELGHESSATGVARLLAPYARCLLVDERDRGEGEGIEAAGLEPYFADTVMADGPGRARVARAVIDALGATRAV